MIDLQKSKAYHRDECVVFLKTKEQFGGLSNMAGGYSLFVNGIRILTSEALYQACRFPHKPAIQKLIIGQASPMTAKMVSKPHRKDSRLDWDDVRIQIMRWCLRVKLAQHWENFGELLLSTGERPIVEESSRDLFWGAKPTNAETLIGTNVLGELLTELREELKSPHVDKLRIVEPPTLQNFLLIEKPISVIEGPRPRLQSKIEQTASEQLALDDQIARNFTSSTKLEQTTAQEQSETLFTLPTLVPHQLKLPFQI